MQSSLFKNAPPGLIFPGDPQYGCGQSLNCDQWAKFFPRVGLVWDPFGDGKTSIRASYGMFGDRNHMFYSTFMHQYAPFGNNISINNANITDPWGNYPGGDPLPALQATGGIGAASPNAPFYPQSTFTIEQLQSYQAPYTNQWNVSIQRQVGTNWLFTVNYLGSSQIHLDTSNLLNPAVYMGLDSCTLPNNVSGQLAYLPHSGKDERPDSRRGVQCTESVEWRRSNWCGSKSEQSSFRQDHNRYQRHPRIISER